MILRFGDIVVGTHLKPHHLVHFLAAGGENQDGNIAGSRTRLELPANLQALDHRKHQVQDDQVGQQCLGPSQTILSIRGVLHLVPLFLEVVHQQFAEGTLVFNDEDGRL